MSACKMILVGLLDTHLGLVILSHRPRARLRHAVSTSSRDPSDRGLVCAQVRPHNLYTRLQKLVSTIKHQAFNPFIWHDIPWCQERQFLPKAIHRHTQLVIAFKADDSIKN
ncbi:hypothetical protein BGZ65_010247, partial [Modicella reniformis]